MSSIIKKFSKQTGVTYVYESESYWNKEKKQPRSRRKLIGKIDEETGGRGNRKKRGLTDVPESLVPGRGLEALCMEQAGQIRQDEEEIAALKKQVMELTLSVGEYKRRLLKIEELSRI